RRHVHRGRQRGGQPCRRRIRQGRLSRTVCDRRRHCCRRARHCNAGQELAPAHLGTRMFSCHKVSPSIVGRGGLRSTPADSNFITVASEGWKAFRRRLCVVNIRESGAFHVARVASHVAHIASLKNLFWSKTNAPTTSVTS